MVRQKNSCDTRKPKEKKNLIIYLYLVNFELLLYLILKTNNSLRMKRNTIFSVFDCSWNLWRILLSLFTVCFVFLETSRVSVLPQAWSFPRRRAARRTRWPPEPPWSTPTSRPSWSPPSALTPSPSDPSWCLPEWSSRYVQQRLLWLEMELRSHLKQNKVGEFSVLFCKRLKMN